MVLIFGVFLFIGCSSLFSNKLSHDYPYGYLASDTFQQQTRIEGIKDAGNYRYEPFYIVTGYKDVVGYYPPLLHHLGVVFSYVSGLETYDAAYFMVFFLSAVAMLMMYFAIKKYNKNIAVLSVPLSMLLFSRAPFIGFVWGHWASLTAQVFLVACCWAFVNLELKHSFILLGIFLTGVALAHSTEFVFVGMFIVFYLLFKVLIKKFSMEELKKILYAGIVCFVLSIYSLIIFKYTYMAAHPFKVRFGGAVDWGGTPLLTMGSFQLLLIFMVIGLVIFLIRYKQMIVPAIFGIFLLGIGYSNYIGFDIRAFQSRFFWPVYFAVFFGAGLYYLLKFFIKKWNLAYSYIISIVFLVFFTMIAVPYVPHYDKITGPGLMDPYHWKTLAWFEDNSRGDETVYFFYGDIYSQDALLRNTKRVHFQVIASDFFDAINNRTIKRYYNTEVPGDSGSGLPYRTGVFSFKLHRDEKNEFYQDGVKDICLFDYYVFDKVSQQQVLAQYNILIANELIKKDWIVPVFENEVSVILKNNKPGEDCIEQRNF